MSAVIRISHGLVEFSDGKDVFDVEPGKSIRKTLLDIGLEPGLFALIIVNGSTENLEYVIKDKDLIKALAIIGGGCN